MPASVSGTSISHSASARDGKVRSRVAELQVVEGLPPAYSSSPTPIGPQAARSAGSRSARATRAAPQAANTATRNHVATTCPNQSMTLV